MYIEHVMHMNIHKHHVMLDSLMLTYHKHLVWLIYGMFMGHSVTCYYCETSQKANFLALIISSYIFVSINMVHVS